MLNRHVKLALLLSFAWLSQAAAHAGELTLFSRDGFQGGQLTVREPVRNLTDRGFNDRAQSMIIQSGRWEVCVDSDFRDCRVLEPGEYRNLERLANNISSMREVGGGYANGNGQDDERSAPVMLFDAPQLRGRGFGLRDDVQDLSRTGFNDMTQSMLIQSGRWEVCVHADFRGPCRVFGPGQYRNMDRTFFRSISSVRQVGNDNRRDDRGQRGERRRDAGVELFAAPGFGGERTAVREELRNLEEIGFNDRAGSLIVFGGQWEFCEHSEFRGRCQTYGPGRYERLGSLQFEISSIRRVR